MELTVYNSIIQRRGFDPDFVESYPPLPYGEILFHKDILLFKAAWFGHIIKDYRYFLLNNHPLCGPCCHAKHHPYSLKYRLRSLIGLLLFSTLFATLGSLVTYRTSITEIGKFAAARGIAFGGGFTMAIMDSFMIKFAICPCAYEKNKKCFKCYTCIGKICGNCIFIGIATSGIAGTIALATYFNIWGQSLFLWFLTWVYSYTFSFFFISVIFFILWKNEIKTYHKHKKYLKMVNQLKQENNEKNENNETTTNGNNNISNNNNNNNVRSSSSSASKSDNVNTDLETPNNGGHDAINEKIKNRIMFDDGNWPSANGVSITKELEAKALEKLNFTKEDILKFEKYNISLLEYRIWRKENIQWVMSPNVISNENNNLKTVTSNETTMSNIQSNENFNGNNINESAQNLQISMNNEMQQIEKTVTFTDIPPPGTESPRPDSSNINEYIPPPPPDNNDEKQQADQDDNVNDEDENGNENENKSENNNDDKDSDDHDG